MTDNSNRPNRQLRLASSGFSEPRRNSEAKRGRMSRFLSLRSIGNRMRRASRRSKSTNGAGKSRVRQTKSFVSGLNSSQMSLSAMLDEEHVAIAKCCLPPPIPQPFNEEDSNDISFFCTTFNASNISHVCDNSLKFWLPKNYDVYCICLQEVESMTETAAKILNFLHTGKQKYVEYPHFIVLVDPKTHKRKRLVTNLYVSVDLVKPGKFSRKHSNKVMFRNNSYLFNTSGAHIIDFTVLDLHLRLVHVFLFQGLEEQDLQQRMTELTTLQREMKRIKSLTDKTILIGDFGFVNPGETIDSALSNYINAPNTIPEWTHDRFACLLEEYDEKLRYELFQEFKEMQIQFPPTNHRLFQRVPPEHMNTDHVVDIFSTDATLENLFSYSSKDLPCYPDRIFFQFDASLESCVIPHKSGTCEGVTMNDRVPVFNSFRVGCKDLYEQNVGGVKLRTAEELQRVRSNYTADTSGLAKRPKIRYKHSHYLKQKRKLAEEMPPDVGLSTNDVKEDLATMSLVEVETLPEQRNRSRMLKEVNLEEEQLNQPPPPPTSSSSVRSPSLSAVARGNLKGKNNGRDNLDDFFDVDLHQQQGEENVKLSLAVLQKLISQMESDREILGANEDPMEETKQPAEKKENKSLNVLQKINQLPLLNEEPKSSDEDSLSGVDEDLKLAFLSSEKTLVSPKAEEEEDERKESVATVKTDISNVKINSEELRRLVDRLLKDATVMDADDVPPPPMGSRLKRLLKERSERVGSMPPEPHNPLIGDVNTSESVISKDVLDRNL